MPTSLEPGARRARAVIAGWRDRPEVRLGIAGFLTLFLELALIRWAPAQTRVLAYYTNFVLLGAFLGLGVGLLARARGRFAAAFPLLLFVTVNAFVAMHSADFDVRWSSDFYLWQFVGEGRPQVHLSVVLVVAFVLIALPFVAIGILMGRDFQAVPRLRGYAFNIGGSLAGILAFTALSALRSPPWSWFLGTAACALVLIPAPSRAWRWGGAGLLGLVVALVAVNEMPYMWSPYSRLALSAIGEPATAWELRVNNDYHQLVLDLSDGSVAGNPTLRRWRDLYDLPHELVPGGGRVLIVGGGTGNDAAAAVRAGAAHVDVVEIDPLIATVGKRLHPERPYHQPHVTVHVDDARAFFRRTAERYDLVVFGFLDSHSVLSSLSSVRLDSYVYTSESLAEARRLLTPRGVVALTFSVEKPWVGQRLHRMMSDAFGEPPLVQVREGTNGTVFLAGPGLDRRRHPEPRHDFAAPGIEPATDAWPFLYFRERGVPSEYVVALVVIAALSTLGVAVACRRAAVRPAPAFFALGAGFMLLETRSVTVLALLLGSTWITNALVFTVILTLSFLATAWTERSAGRPPTAWVAGLLLASLALVLVLPLDAFVGVPAVVRIPAAGLVMLPVLFAGVLFARAFERASDPDVALGSNLLGAVAGGLCEYAALVIGFPGLVFVAAAFYALALATWRTAARPPAAT